MTRTPLLPRRGLLAGTAALLAAPSIVRAQGKEPLKIGSALPLTGSQAGYGNECATGWRQAVADVNAAGGILGRQIELITLDTQAEPQLGINAANRFIGVEKLPMFYTAAVLYINNDTGIDAAKLYRDTFIAAGGKIVAFEAYDPKATEFTGMLLKARAANPEIVHVHGLTADTPQVIAQMRQLGMTQRITSYSAAYNPKLVQQLGPAAEGIIVTSLAPGVNDNPNVGKFLERWKAEQGRVPNGLPYVQYQYDMVYLTKALYEYVDKKGQVATGDTLREALLTIGTFDLPMTGQMVLDGHRVNKPVYLLTVEKGAFVPLATL